MSNKQHIFIRRKVSNTSRFISVFKLFFFSLSIFLSLGIIVTGVYEGKTTGEIIIIVVGLIFIVSLPLAFVCALILPIFLSFYSKGQQKYNLLNWHRKEEIEFESPIAIVNHKNISSLYISTYPLPIVTELTKYIQNPLERCVAFADNSGKPIYFLFSQPKKRPIDIFLEKDQTEKDIIPFEVITNSKEFVRILHTVIKNNPQAEVDDNLYTYDYGEDESNNPDGEIKKEITEDAFYQLT